MPASPVVESAGEAGSHHEDTMNDGDESKLAPEKAIRQAKEECSRLRCEVDHLRMELHLANQRSEALREELRTLYASVVRW